MNMISKAVVVLFGSLMISIGVNSFIMPNQIIDGGMIGIALILNYIWDISVGLSFILLSIPIFIIVWFYKRQYCINSALGMVLTGFFIDTMQFYPVVPLENPLMHSLLGGICIGLGIGCLFLCDISTDSVDLLAQVLSISYKWNVGILIFLFDLLVVIGAIVFLTNDALALSLITITTNGLVTTSIISVSNSKLSGT